MRIASNYTSISMPAPHQAKDLMPPFNPMTAHVPTQTEPPPSAKLCLPTTKDQLNKYEENVAENNGNL